MKRFYRVLTISQFLVTILFALGIIYVDWQRRVMTREMETRITTHLDKHVKEIYSAIEEHQKITLAILKNDAERARRIK